jgi:RHS repeat-associated protein
LITLAPASSCNVNVVVNHGFDAVTGRMNNITTGLNGGAALQNSSYLFDEVGNLIQRQDNKVGVTENVYYDALNRLDHTVGDTNTKLTYDSMGRLSTWEAYGNSTNVNDYATPQAGCTYYANAQPHAVRNNTQGTWPPGSFCYDANGNMATQIASGSAIESQTWTSYNQPNVISMTGYSSQFWYDQNHQRWKHLASYNGSPETTEYIGGLLEKMKNETATAYRYYVAAGNTFIVYNRWSMGSNPIYYVTKDHLGSSAIITDQTGALVVSERFSALGWNENTSAEQAVMANVTRREFTGQEGLDNFGMVNMNGRVYIPSGSMFISPDPTIPDPTNTLSYNRYAYVTYNPLTQIDPSGFENIDGYKTMLAKQAYTGKTLAARQSAAAMLFSMNAAEEMAAESGALDVGGGGGGGDDLQGLVAAVQGRLDAGEEILGRMSQSAGSTGTSSATTTTISDSANSDSGPQGNAPISPDEVVVNAARMVPNANYGPPDLTGSFTCGSFQCSYQMGQSLFPGLGQRGVWLTVNLHGKTGNGRWVQTYIDSNTNQFSPDCQGSCPYYTSDWRGGNYFIGTPTRFIGSSVTWVAQASYVLPNQSAAFTFMWGFSLSNGATTYISPVPATPWASQQQLIQGAR